MDHAAAVAELASSQKRGDLIIAGRPGPGRPGGNNRAPLPAGHPTSWGAITAGTMLAEAVYPHPVFTS